MRDALRHVHCDVVRDVSYAKSFMQGEVLDVERRLPRNDDEKMAIISSVGIDRVLICVEN